MARAHQASTWLLKSSRLRVAYPHSSRMTSRLSHEAEMSTAAFNGRSQKRLRPGKVSAKISRHSVRSARTMGSANQADTARNTSTEIDGSRKAATSEVTDWGAL